MCDFYQRQFPCCNNATYSLVQCFSCTTDANSVKICEISNCLVAFHNVFKLLQHFIRTCFFFHPLSCSIKNPTLKIKNEANCFVEDLQARAAFSSQWWMTLFYIVSEAWFGDVCTSVVFDFWSGKSRSDGTKGSVVGLCVWICVFMGELEYSNKTSNTDVCRCDGPAMFSMAVFIFDGSTKILMIFMSKLL